MMYKVFHARPLDPVNVFVVASILPSASLEPRAMRRRASASLYSRMAKSASLAFSIFSSVCALQSSAWMDLKLSCAG